MNNLPKVAKESISYKVMIRAYEKACRLSQSKDEKTHTMWQAKAEYLSDAMTSIANEHGVPPPKRKNK